MDAATVSIMISVGALLVAGYVLGSTRRQYAGPRPGARDDTYVIPVTASISGVPYLHW